MEASVTEIFAFVSDTYLDRQLAAAPGRPAQPLRPLKRQMLEQRRAVAKDWDQRALQSGTPENQVAWELNIGIERLGLACWSGLIPLRVVLPLAADQLVEDWLLCYAWLKDYRRREATFAPDGTAFHRRHGEWLVLAAWAWLSNAYPDYPPLKEISGFYGSEQKAAQLFQRLMKSAFDAPAPTVRAEFRAMLG